MGARGLPLHHKNKTPLLMSEERGRGEELSSERGAL
jgi:hypothetical protein